MKEEMNQRPLGALEDMFAPEDGYSGAPNTHCACKRPKPSKESYGHECGACGGMINYGPDNIGLVPPTGSSL